MRRETPSYRELLAAKIGEKRYKEISKGFDVLGNIAIIDADKSVAGKVARIVMDTHKSVETVLRKGGPVSGRYRTRKYVFVLGKKNYTARYNENGASFVFDVRKVYFSPRLAYERKRITDLSKDGESVVVMFAGIGPFAIEIAKKNKKSKIIAIELNKMGYKYAIQNIRINKTDNVTPILGDAAKPPKKYKNFADRIIMPLPMDSYRFLESAFAMAGKRCIVHYYAFVDDEGDEEIVKVKKFSIRHGRKFKLLGKRIVRPYSARTTEIVLDFEIARK
jgi:tRNA (guanine37-N1)-methyltransferase